MSAVISRSSLQIHSDETAPRASFAARSVLTMIPSSSARVRPSQGTAVVRRESSLSSGILVTDAVHFVTVIDLVRSTAVERPTELLPEFP